ncbi:PREDICTED: annexin D5-like isoform X2 [Lupinus angustifolius]|uniref:annexin D5-like isoform X2 n=1 Tax=Lupinus angustifolius TaxID=3871 RepID=UPI00092ED4D4|nr:PREDICTED: annexin D5-like isoform X2 [Lupinus angustifolius]
MSTLTLPPVPPHPKDDAIQLYKAFKGFGCDDSAVINVLAHRDATQRAYIQQEFRTMYSEDLLKRLTKELSGKLETAVLLWMHDPAGRDAIILKQSLTVTKILEAATEVICSRTPSQLQHLRQIYHSRFGVFLEHDIERHTSGDHKKILLAYVTTPRHEGPEVNREIAENDAKALYKAGEKKLGTDEKTFVQILSERSAAHLAAVSFAYQHKHGHSLEKVLRKAMKGLGTNDETLIRVIVTRTEIDLQYIKAEYLKKYKKTLHDAVHSETSGHYRAFLLSLIGPNH